MENQELKGKPESEYCAFSLRKTLLNRFAFRLFFYFIMLPPFGCLSSDKNGQYSVSLLTKTVIWPNMLIKTTKSINKIGHSDIFGHFIDKIGQS